MHRISHIFFSNKLIFKVLLPLAAILMALFNIMRHNYLLFHSVIEIFSIAVSIGLFFFSRGIRNQDSMGFFGALGSTYLFVGLTDMLHTLAFKGMGVFPGSPIGPADLATQLWIVARGIQVIGTFLSIALIRQLAPSSRQTLFFTTLLGMWLAAMASIFFWKNFPHCFIDGQGLTAFKINAEYVMIGVLLLCVGQIFHLRRHFSPRTFFYLVISLAGMVLSEAAFTVYVDVHGIFNGTGHLLKAVSYYFLYAATIGAVITDPFQTIFNQLTREIARREELEQNLRIARDEAEAANQAKSQFLANMSHEIRTPMNGIIGMTDLVLLSELDARQQKNLQIVRSSAHRLLTIINDILDLAKIEGGHMELHPGEFSLQRLIGEEILPLHEPMLIDRPLALRSRIDPKLTRKVIGDPLRLSQILNNLVGNAVKFTPSGNIDLDVEIVGELADGFQLKFSVRDEGIGISEQAMSKLFNHFSQVDTSLTKKYGGTGLGLAISKSLVEKMGGSISVTSTPGKGSCFSFIIPLACGAELADGSMPPPHLKAAALLAAQRVGSKSPCP
jgi:signal transduction histidine kinase